MANLLSSAVAGCPPPPAPTTAELVKLRFEDVTQDGRLVLEALPLGLEPIWRFLAQSPYRVFREQGIAAILTRLVLEGTAGPFSASAPVTAEATYRIVASETGAIHLDMWSTLSARLGQTYDPLVTDPMPPAIAVAGRVFAEHTFTRPFAPRGQRRIIAFDFEGAPEVRERRAALPAPSTLIELPVNSRPLDSSLKLDSVPVTFGIVHTDGNMHANSLAYLRIFEEAALRRFVALGRGSKVLGRGMEIAYRKPCFAGQQVRIALQAFERESSLGVVGVLVDEAQAQLPTAEWVTGARTHVRMGFDP